MSSALCLARLLGSRRRGALGRIWLLGDSSSGWLQRWDILGGISVDIILLARVYGLWRWDLRSRWDLDKPRKQE